MKKKKRSSKRHTMGEGTGGNEKCCFCGDKQEGRQETFCGKVRVSKELINSTLWGWGGAQKLEDGWGRGWGEKRKM